MPAPNLSTFSRGREAISHLNGIEASHMPWLHAR
jgi:hypothetical protein